MSTSNPWPWAIRAGAVLPVFALLSCCPPATADEQVVLGSPEDDAYARGYGSERPSVISLGNCASSVHDITWDRWGGPVAHGTGTQCDQNGEGPQYEITASDLGSCNGVPAYRTLQIGSDSPRDICD